MGDKRRILLEKIQKDIEEKQKLISELSDNSEKLETLREVRARVLSKGEPVKYLTGVDAIDDNMGGFSEGSFINIAGSNFSGKTTFVLSVISNIAKYNRSVFFSFEMYENLLVTNKLRDDSIDDNLVVVQDKNLLIDIEDIIRKEYKNNNVKFFAIDSMMKIRVVEKMQDNQKASLISSTLAKLSQELGVIILLINQVALSDIREKRLEFKGSGDISYDSDVNLFITVDEKDNSRMLHCKKDRINEKVWKQDITDKKYQGTVSIYNNIGNEFSIQPEIVSYEPIDMPELL